MNLFAGTAPFYRKYRPGIPPAVADVLDGAVPPGTPRRLLDIGTGTGQVVEALLGRFDDIIAIDNDAEMLAAADSQLRPQLPPGTTLLLRQSTAEAFESPSGWLADLVTICRTFHWLDQQAVLARLEGQVQPHGAVAIFGDNSFWVATSPWKRAVRSCIQQFLGEERRAGAGTFSTHDRPYSEIMQESPFSVVEEITVPVHREWTSETIIGYLYSTSFAAPHLFGDRRDAFEQALRETLRKFSDDDTFPEENEFLLRIGRRP
ncbi:Methyltransferase domain-containing protein [Geodermatophilus obscurus]|uniref:Methyltransferase domain-containing protein n=1 Tax=Geodermatophilus obscurus TaxID=1861 RepID=A0A1M7S2K7_9ACTN|nr:methyltransferase domain-containing protein [Geodermatophilus obscurus]SHN52698.1 Methyltransferase domain-containing protein [Geodermatophilus obscurus]